MEKITLLDTAEGSTNKGDEIIMECFKEEMSDILDKYFILSAPTHLRSISFLESIYKLPDSANEISLSKYKFACGTNLLSSNLFHRSNQWNINFSATRIFKNTILVGVGGNIKLPKGIAGKYTKRIYRDILDKEFIHSVRTEKAKESLQKMGYKAYNTGCVTLWKFTPDFCNQISKKKAPNAVITLTDYNRDEEVDRRLIEIVSKNYEKIYFWPQGIYDDIYLKKLFCGGEKENKKIELLPASVEKYKELLMSENIDYVGTRFHGGIYAMRHKARCIIVTLDDRMKSMQSGIRNNCIARKDVVRKLDEKINSEIETVVDINFEAIRKWKEQFL